MLAEGRLHALLERGEQTGHQLLSALALTQHIELLLDTGREPQARQALIQALEAASGGALQPFDNLLKKHPDWLRDQLQHSATAKVSPSLLAQLPAAVTRPSVDAPCEQLSSRELAVLKLIAQGCSNQEISDQLFISLHTVKTHASHINSKLGVERRTQAVARAKELGVLV
ncbi:Transcriptional regulatory protein LiaR [compost metagenome]